MLSETAPQCWKDVDIMLNAGIDRMILHGPPGTGKTHAGLNMGDTNRGAHRLICTEDMTDFDIIGGFMPAGAEWAYHEGAAIRAWEGDGLAGGRLVIDEIDRASGDVLALLLAMTDSAESAQWEHPKTSRIHRPRDGFTVIMTTNVENPADLPEALIDRFPATVRVDRPHPDALRRLPREFRDYADKMADAGSKRISLRKFYDIAKLMDKIGLEEASRLLLGKEAQGFVDAITVDQVN